MYPACSSSMECYCKLRSSGRKTPLFLGLPQSWTTIKTNWYLSLTHIPFINAFGIHSLTINWRYFSFVKNSSDFSNFIVQKHIESDELLVSFMWYHCLP